MLLECIYPTHCRNCRVMIAPRMILCARCMCEVHPVPSIILPVTKNIILTVHSVARYDGPVKHLVTKKFSYDPGASKEIARLMLAYTPIRTKNFDAIVPIPLHWTRYAWRGFNQSYEMAQVLSNELQVPVVNCVKRIRKTKFQWALSHDQRHENVRAAFKATADTLCRKHVLIVDDLCTTGATLVNVARVLAVYKPASITAVVGCRAV